MSKTKQNPEPEATEPEKAVAAEPETEADVASVSAMADKSQADAEPRFEILFDTVGAGPSFQKGEVVTASDVEFLGIERLLEIGAIREL